MKKRIYQKLADVVAVLFSLLTIVEGTQVLLGKIKPEYIVLKPLLIYNVTMGFVGIIVGIALWINRKGVLTHTTIISAVHLFVLFVIEVLFFFGGYVAEHSVKAMIVRSAVWLAIVVVIWRTGSTVELNITGNK